MTIETSIELFNKLEQDKLAQNFYARGYARYIYFGVDDKPSENLERNLNFGSDNLAFSYLSIGASMFENDYAEIKEGKEIRRLALEKGAEFIEYNHYYEQNRNDLSAYYLLVGALAYYASSQYSKAFVLMKKVENIYKTDVSTLTSSFLKKDFKTVFNVLNKVLLDDNYISKVEENQTTDGRIQVVLYAKAFASLMDFLYFGIDESLQETKEVLNDLLELLEIEQEPSMWWVVRLLIIIVNGLEKSSLWTTILPRVPNNENSLTSNYINNLIFSKSPIIELFVVQRKALSKVLSEKGAVVSLPTSSGKTRIAEIAILDCLSKIPSAKILYLAPFRSLAFEVESSLNQTLGKVGLVVSQLYGSGQFSSVDRMIIENANILVATPEKAKVILRANTDITQQIKLVIIDEGHLLNEQERQVRNEMFIEELKKYVRDNCGKIILLSAVLPNTSEIAQWVTDFEEPTFIQNNEKIARQRLGFLKFIKGRNSVHLDWQGAEKSFNANFIAPMIPLKRDGTRHKGRKIRPSDKKEAVAYTALKLSLEKPLLIFIASANSVLSFAENVYDAMKKTNALVEYKWKRDIDWKILELACEEDSSKDNERILRYAKHGILCHKRSMNNELKQVIERLMRKDKPRIIIATMTLGQGVNLGISTIIFGGVNFYDITAQSQKSITNSDFWNIAGRAGRAFTDSEGKILFATDNDDDINLGLNYFNNKPENTLSGLLKQIEYIKRIANQCGVDFNQLLTLISENDFQTISRWQDKFTKVIIKDEIQDFFDWIDDALLSLQIKFEETPEKLDDYFRQTLAYIQARNFEGLDQEDVVKFLKARCKAITEKIVPDGSLKSRLVSSGLPLASAVKLDEVFQEIVNSTTQYLSSSKGIDDKINLVKHIEEIKGQMPSVVFKKQKFEKSDIDKIRTHWLKGDTLNNIEVNNPHNVCNNYFIYPLSWFLGAIANRIKQEENEEYAEYSIVYEELALCCELGLPNLLSSKIYLAGINSRTAAKEISEIIDVFNEEDDKEENDLFLLLSLFELSIDSESTIPKIKNYIISKLDKILEKVQDPITIEWLKIFKRTQKDLTGNSYYTLPTIPTELANINTSYNRLFMRRKGEDLFLCSADYKFRKNINSSQWIDRIEEDKFFFKFEDGEWTIISK